MKDKMIEELKSERDHHRKERKDLENELRRIHEMVHELIRQLHKYHNNSTIGPLHLKSSYEGLLGF